MISMNQFLLYLGSGLIAALVGYFTNQLPNLPENLKPWVPLALAVLILIAAIILIKQSSSGTTQSSSGTTPYKTAITNNDLPGKNAKIKATDALVDKNKLGGENSSISTNDHDPGQQP